MKSKTQWMLIINRRLDPTEALNEHKDISEDHAQNTAEIRTGKTEEKD